MCFFQSLDNQVHVGDSSDEDDFQNFFGNSERDKYKPKLEIPYDSDEDSRSFGSNVKTENKICSQDLIFDHPVTAPKNKINIYNDGVTSHHCDSENKNKFTPDTKTNDVNSKSDNTDSDKIASPTAIKMKFKHNSKQTKRFQLAKQKK